MKIVYLKNKYFGCFHKVELIKKVPKKEEVLIRYGNGECGTVPTSWVLSKEEYSNFLKKRKEENIKSVLDFMESKEIEPNELFEFIYKTK